MDRKSSTRGYAHPDYHSLMSYTYQNECPASSVMSYSGLGDPIFNDFANLRHDFPLIPIHIGNSFGRGLGLVAAETEPEQTIADVEAQFGPLDLTAPIISIDAPVAGTTVAVGTSLTVKVTATDDKLLDKVLVLFDVDGDGSADSPGENIEAVNIGVNTFLAVFNGITGDSGTREITGIAIDASSNLDTTTTQIIVSSGIAPVQIPNLVGQLQASAEGALTAIGLLSNVTMAPSGTVPTDVVISQNPAAGISVATGSTVNLIVSSDVEQVTVPDIVGQTQTSAETMLTNVGLEADASAVSNDIVPAGSVISQNPAANTSTTTGMLV